MNEQPLKVGSVYWEHSKYSYIWLFNMCLWAAGLFWHSKNYWSNYALFVLCAIASAFFKASAINEKDDTYNALAVLSGICMCILGICHILFII